MLTITNIKTKLENTWVFVPDGNFGNGTSWLIKLVQTNRDLYQICLKCIEIKPAGPILGNECILNLDRKQHKTNPNTNIKWHILKNILNGKFVFISINDIKTQNDFMQFLSKQLNELI
jgi:hypothetical protein